MKKNVWHSIEQGTSDASIDQWHSRLKTRICAEGGHFNHMTDNCVEKQSDNILREHFTAIRCFFITLN